MRENWIEKQKLTELTELIVFKYTYASFNFVEWSFGCRISFKLYWQFFVNQSCYVFKIFYFLFPQLGTVGKLKSN